MDLNKTIKQKMYVLGINTSTKQNYSLMLQYKQNLPKKIPFKKTSCRYNPLTIKTLRYNATYNK